MKKILCILCLLLIFSSCSKTFDGYSYSLEDERKSEKVYNSYDYFFTAEQDNVIVDFLIRDGLLHIVKIDCKEQGSKTVYKVKSTASYSVVEALAYFEKTGKVHWVQTGKFPAQVEWTIVTENVPDAQQADEGFEFFYNDTLCILYYRILK